MLHPTSRRQPLAHRPHPTATSGLLYLPLRRRSPNSLVMDRTGADKMVVNTAVLNKVVAGRVATAISQ